MRLYHHLIGRIELEKGNISKAIEYFKEAISLLSSGPLTYRAGFIASLALAYMDAGDLEKARQEYERIATLTSGRIGHGYVYATSFYRLGKIYEEMKGRIKETDESVPMKNGDYYYYYRTEEGKNYRIHCRKFKTLDAAEQVILDGNGSKSAAFLLNFDALFSLYRLV